MKNLKKSLKTILKLGIFSALLFVFVALYFADIVHKYQDEVTTITTKREPIQKPIWPSITICMEKAFQTMKNVIAVPHVPQNFWICEVLIYFCHFF